MEKKIKQILKDIYSIDKSLKDQEEYLIKVIQELLLSRPSNVIDENFVSSLRAKLIERSEALKGETKNMPKFSFGNLSYVFAGVAIVMLAVISFINVPGEQQTHSLSVAKTADNAFGEITFSVSSANEESAQRSNATPSLGTGEGAPESNVATKDSSSIGYGVTGSGATVPAPDYLVNYKYVYDGEDFEVPSGQVTVYKKLPGTVNNSFSSLLSGISLSDVDLSKFTNLKVDSLQVSENKDYGYTIYAYLQDDTIYISQNWNKWSQSYRDEQTSPVNQLSNDQVKAIADKFLSDYSINVSTYGQGEVLEYPDRENAWTSSATVVYPLQLEGKDVYNQSGYKYGLNVIVDFGTGKVSSVNPLSTSNFQSSNYNSDLTKDEIISFAKNGGLQRIYNYEGATKTVEIKLGTPKYALVETWKQDGNSSSELMVPSFIFPIEGNEDHGYYYGNNGVVVPLVGEMMNQGGDVPVIMMEKTQ